MLHMGVKMNSEVDDGRHVEMGRILMMFEGGHDFLHLDTTI